MISTASRDFKGVWIPKEVWLDGRLSMLDKGILTEIDSLDMGESGCFASNEHLAEFCQCSERKVSESISKLIDLGYVTVISFDGRKRFLRSCLAFSAMQDGKNCEAVSQKVRDSNTYSNTSNKPSKDICPSHQFLDFYSVYPNKVKRKDALTAWNAAKLDNIADTIIADVKLRCETEWKGINKRYIPHPTTYLHQRRWEDETPPTERRNTAKEQQPVTERAYEDVTEENFDKYW